MFGMIVTGFLVGLVSIFWASFGIVGPLIVICASRPLIKQLDKLGLINAHAARQRNGITLALWLIIDAIVIGLMLLFANKAAWVGFFIGVGVILLMSSGKLSARNPSNKEDFLKSYAVFFDEGKTEAVVVAIMAYPKILTIEEINAEIRMANLLYPQ